VLIPSTQLNSTQLNSTQLNSTQLNSTQLSDKNFYIDSFKEKWAFCASILKCKKPIFFNKKKNQIGGKKL